MADKGLPEMGFMLGGLDELNDPDIRCLIAVGADRTVHGITSWMPVYAGGRPVGWTLDFMRRNTEPGTFRGVMEFLIATAALTFQEEGARFVSLSGAPLARLDRGERAAPRVQRAARHDRQHHGAGLRLPVAAAVQGQVPAASTSRSTWPTRIRPRSAPSPPRSAAPTCPHLTSRQALRLLTKLLRPHPNLGRLAAP